MNIEFPCPERFENLRKIKGTYHCNHCGENLVEVSLDRENETVNSQKGSFCMIKYTLKPEESFYSLKKFGLALLLVFGSSLFVISNAQLEKQLKTLNQDQEVCPVNASTVIVTVIDRNKNMTSAIVKALLPNGKELLASNLTLGVYQLDLPAYALGKDIEVVVSKRDKQKVEVINASSYGEIIDVDFLFRSKKFTRVFRTMGCPSF